MLKYSASFHHGLIRSSELIHESLSKTQYTPSETTQINVKKLLQSLLPSTTSEEDFRKDVTDFCLCCAALISAEGEKEDSLLSWVPEQLSVVGKKALEELEIAFFRNSDNEEKLAIVLMPQVLPLLKTAIKESSIDLADDENEISAASARTPVAYAIVAAYQFRWFVTQVSYPYLGNMCSLVIPCALTTLDHWSPAVKAQGMVGFIHLAKNVNAADLGLYEDVILDICCRNIACDDILWHLVVEMSVLLLTSIQGQNPRSSWFEKMVNEMLSHLERQLKNKERCTTWLKLIEPLFNSMGLVLLSHFRRIFPLLFQWMHSDDDSAIIMVLQRTHTIIKLTWIRNTPYIERLVDELTTIHKEAAMRKAHDEIRKEVLEILMLLQKCKGMQFEATWRKHKDDPNLSALALFLCSNNVAMVAN